MISLSSGGTPNSRTSNDFDSLILSIKPNHLLEVKQIRSESPTVVHKSVSKVIDQKKVKRKNKKE